MSNELFTLYSISVIISAGIIGWLAGGFREWDKQRDLRKELHNAYRETEELREYIWLVTTGSPTTQSLTPAGALPTESVKVERSRHLSTVDGGATE